MEFGWLFPFSYIKVGWYMDMVEVVEGLKIK